MIITPPRAIECSLEPKEVETIENCITLLKDIMNKMNEYDYSYLHINNDEEITNGELTDLIIDLMNLRQLDTMYWNMYTRAMSRKLYIARLFIEIVNKLTTKSTGRDCEFFHNGKT